jgi:hypothetical protein
MRNKRFRREPSNENEPAYLRRVALLLGQLLGLPRAEVTDFAEELTGEPWRSCGVDELHLVIDDLQVLLAAALLKERRRAERSARPAPSWGWPDVSPN